MDRFGNDFDSATGSVMTRAQLEDQRRKRGECVTCGRKCFQKKLFKTIPITDHGRVLNGRCLNCHPITSDDNDQGMTMSAVSRRATAADLERFNAAQSNLPAPSAASGRPSSRSRQRAQSVRNPSYKRNNNSTRSLPVASGGRNAYSSGNSVTSAGFTRPSDASECSEFSSHEASSGSSRRVLDPSIQDRGTRNRHSYAPGQVQDLSGGEEQFEALDEYVPRPQEANGDRQISREASGHSYDDDSSYYSFQSGSQAPSYGTPRENYGRSYYSTSQTSLRSSESLPPAALPDDASSGYQESPHRVLDRGGAFAPPSYYSASSPRQGRSIPRGSRGNSSGSLGSSSAASFNNDSAPPTPQGDIEGYLDHRRQLQMQQMQQLSQRMEQHYSDSSNGEPHESQGEPDYIPDDTSSSVHPGLQLLREVRFNFVEILNVMREFPEDLEVQGAALHELSEVQLTEEDSTVLAEIGGIQVIVDTMYAFPSALDLQISGCRAVWNASGTAQNQHDFVQMNVLDIILQDMEEFADPNLQEQAMAALANLAALEVNLDIMVEKGVFKWVVNAMSKHNESVDVIVKGCLVIANLSSHPTDLKKSMMEMGGGGALVIAMVMHPTAAELQEKALRGLRNLSANCDENKVELTNIGGIDAVIGAMQVHRDAAGVQEAGAWTLSNLASNADANALIGDCGGIDVLIRAMWVHSDFSSVLEWCCRALFTLALDDRNSHLILEVGGIAAVINAMQAHVDGSSVIQEMGCAVLCNLASDESSKVRIVEEEALDAIVLAMVLYSEDENVQVRACQVLLRLGIPQNLKAMQASNVAELVRASSDKFPESCGEPAHLLLEGLESYISQYG